MDPLARETYLTTEVMTAPPQKLHLMLVDGAIRFIHKARQHWAAREDAQAGEALIRAQEIVGHLLAGLNQEVDPELVKRVAALYLFIYRALMEASFHRNEARLAEALRILEIERDTWRQLCERIGARPLQADPKVRPAPPPRPIDTGDPREAEPSPGRLSLEA